MKLLHDRRVVKGLQELIIMHDGKETSLEGHRTLRRTEKHKMRTCEMRLAAKIGEYEMDQVILDLESDVIFFPKQTWERMGRLALQWSPI